MKILTLLILLSVSIIPLSTNNTNKLNKDNKREVVDKIGFAQFNWQLEKLISRINNLQKKELDNAVSKIKIPETKWKTVISPHDDYSYVGYLYPSIMQNLKAKTIILFGVAHKAKSLGLENKLVFDTFEKWHGPYGPVTISDVRDKLINKIPGEFVEKNTKMHKIEHSLEALIPFIQFYNKDIEIVPILVPYMDYNTISVIGEKFSKALAEIARENKWKWGDDFAIVISSDSVHYGDKGWGGKNFAKFGTDMGGYNKAVLHEHKIIKTSLSGYVNPGKIKLFTEYTVKKKNYKEYKWTWCGRYSIPLGLMVSYYLGKELSAKLYGTLVGYRTSIDLPPLKVEDLDMGVTAPANLNHWVGYTAIGYK